MVFLKVFLKCFYCVLSFKNVLLWFYGCVSDGVGFSQMVFWIVMFLLGLLMVFGALLVLCFVEVL